MNLLITLPLPPIELHPNSQAHWGRKHPKAQQCKGDARLAAIAARNSAGMKEMFTSPVGQPTFYFKTKRRRDSDNCSAWLKPVWDGFQGVLYVNDSLLTPMPAIIKIDSQDPRLEIEITEGSLTTESK